jgi:hypothetical protein
MSVGCGGGRDGERAHPPQPVGAFGAGPMGGGFACRLAALALAARAPVGPWPNTLQDAPRPAAGTRRWSTRLAPPRWRPAAAASELSDLHGSRPEASRRAERD